MTLHLTPAEEAGEGLADAVSEAAARQVQAALPDMEQPALATVVGTDGRIMRLVIEADRGVSMHIGGRGNPLRLDRFQFAALALAIEHHLESFGP
jgi:hypothetical protein